MGSTRPRYNDASTRSFRQRQKRPRPTGSCETKDRWPICGARSTRCGGRSMKGNGNGARDEVVLVTGFPAFTAQRIVRKVLESDGRTRVLLLVREKFKPSAQAFVAQLAPARRKRIELLV